MKDILVVGAGPSGSACAWKLSRAGVNCILADAAVFPRPKICGGVLSRRAVSLLTQSGMLTTEEIRDLTVQTHSTMTITWDFQQLRTYRKGDPPVHLINRTGFDSFLRRRALEEGARPMEGTFAELAGSRAIFSSGAGVPFERIVGADGASSTVRKCFLGGRTIRQSPSLSVVVPLSGKALEPFRELGMQIFFFSGMTGYGWLFPRVGDAVAGIGSFQDPHGNLQDMMKRLLVHTGLGTSSPVRGAILPGGNQRVIPGRGSCLLAGDAACLCDRVSGEGISHAIESGFAVAEAIISGGETWHENARCVRLVKQSLRYRTLLYRKPFSMLANGALKRSDRWFEKYWNIICGQADYSSLLKP